MYKRQYIDGSVDYFEGSPLDEFNYGAWEYGVSEPSQLRFFTTDYGSTDPSEVMRLSAEGITYVAGGTEVVEDKASGDLIVGSFYGVNQPHIAIDNHAIQAKSSGDNAATLFINNVMGGRVHIGNGTHNGTGLTVYNTDTDANWNPTCHLKNWVPDSNNTSIILMLEHENISGTAGDSQDVFVLFSDNGTTIGVITGDEGVGYGGLQYLPFTGAHLAPIDDSEISVLSESTGLIVSSNGIPLVEGVISEAYTGATLTTTEKDKAVYGVISRRPWSPSELDFGGWKGEARAITVNAVGNGRVWVTNIAGEINNGDYICSSNIAGYGQLQDDDLMHNYTVAKSTEKINWDSVEDTIVHNGLKYKKYLVACTYHCG